MKNKAIEVKIIEMSNEKIIVKLPFAKIPIQMNKPFFIKRLKDGYFKLNRPDQLYSLFAMR